MDFYNDGHGPAYLELHAKRAPIAAHGYYEGMDDVDVEIETDRAVSDFEARFGVTVYRLGRSGRHVCIEDTAENRRRYPNLRRAAIAAVRRLFASWKNTNRIAGGAR